MTDQKAPEQLFETMNADSKRLIQGLMRSEDTAAILTNLTSVWTELVMQPWTNPTAWFEMVSQYQQN